MTLLEGVILGILQGITEFLPISSDGHLVLAKALFGHRVEAGHAFDVAIHFGTLLATVTVFRRELGPLVRGIPRFVAGFRSPAAFRERWRTDPAARFLGYIAISAIPAGVAGVWFEDEIAAMNDRPSLLGPLFLAGGLWLAGTFFARAGHRKIGLADSVLLGVVQAIAILPAVSRSGMTLGCGVYRGIERASLGTFAFLMSIPPVAGAVALESRRLGSLAAPLWPTVAGVAAAWVSGVLALRLLMPVVLKGRLGWFGLYCVALGVFCLFRFP